jgi:predicted SnoaL-like aldol condensation-catalyzing enzyme
MSLEANKAIARRVWDEVFNKRDLALADELVAADAINHEAPPGVPARGPESLKAAVTWLSAAFPDMHMAIDDVIAEGDKVVLQTTMSGTHQGPFWGIAPTGRRFAQHHVHVVRLADAKVVEHWAVRDDLGFLQQLGAAPATGSSVPL